MTIKVIERGNIKEIYEGKCYNCGCKIVCDREDVIFEDRPCGGAFVECPTKKCKGRIPCTLIKNLKEEV